MKNSQAGRVEFLNSYITTLKLFVAFSENHKFTLKIVCAFLYFDMGSCLMHITSICYTDGTKKPYGIYFSGSWTLKMDITKESFIFWAYILSFDF